MESQVSGKRELITKAYRVLCADDDNWKSLGNSQDITGNGAEHEATKPICVAGSKPDACWFTSAHRFLFPVPFSRKR